MTQKQEQLVLSFDQLLDDFVDYLKLEKRFSQNTILAYSKDIADFITVLSSYKLTSPKEIGSEHLLAFLLSLHKKNISARSQARILSSLKSFFQFLRYTSVLQHDPAQFLESPKLLFKIPEILSPDLVDSLLNAPDTRSHLGLRDAALLQVFYASGMRISEMVNLSLEQIDFQSGWARPTGKGNKERFVPLGSESIKALQAYLEKERPQLLKGKSTNAVFVGRGGKTLTRQRLWMLVKKYAKLAGITKRVTPHILRHSFATHMMENGADLRSLQLLLGHADIASTQIYTHVSKKHIKALHKKFHPRG